MWIQIYIFHADPDPRGLRIQERRIDIQPAEDEEDPGYNLIFA